MLVVAQVSQVVTGQAAVKRRKGGLDQIALLINNTGRCAVHLPDNTVLLAGLLFLIGTECPAMQMLATQQYRVEFQHVVTGFSVSTATLTAGIGRNHAADGRSIGGRELWGKKQPVGL